MKKSILVVGSVAFDDIETPVGKRFNALGGSAVYFSLAASQFSQVNLVGVAGEDYPKAAIDLLNRQGIDTTGLEIAPGPTFRWGGRYHQDLNNRDTLYTHLNVFANFSPKIPSIYQRHQSSSLATFSRLYKWRCLINYPSRNSSDWIQ